MKRRFTRQDAASAIVLGVACAVVFVLLNDIVGPLLSEPSESREIGAMWAVVSTIFVFRAHLTERLQDARTRITATTVSLVICLAYLLIFPVTAVGVGAVIAAGAVLVVLVGRPQDASLTGITSTVVLVVADLGPASDRWLQPLLRMLDTTIGIAVGFLAAAAFTWAAGRLTPSTRQPLERSTS
ncbi:hypothetical protein C5C39_02265 [Rathayibacter sp. AY1F3]|uniref:FUSC family protein n=1 Tax=Rathayibacter sp. AY1F3 TaxID=2080558 RepID=UPI000CE72EF0|nr:FUSC family protein [Rathayibacter sp. AY1F3]PPG92855.1 hypothetical protein C5C39_02265 [Rathayibacter sp. AY1F3]